MEKLAQVPQAQQFSAVVLCIDLNLTVKLVTRGWFSLGHSTSAYDKGLRKIASNAQNRRPCNFRKFRKICNWVQFE